MANSPKQLFPQIMQKIHKSKIIVLFSKTDLSPSKTENNSYFNNLNEISHKPIGTPISNQSPKKGFQPYAKRLSMLTADSINYENRTENDFKNSQSNFSELALGKVPTLEDTNIPDRRNTKLLTLITENIASVASLDENHLNKRKEST